MRLFRSDFYKVWVVAGFVLAAFCVPANALAGDPDYPTGRGNKSSGYDVKLGPGAGFDRGHLFTAGDPDYPVGTESCGDPDYPTCNETTGDPDAPWGKKNGTLSFRLPFIWTITLRLLPF